MEIKTKIKFKLLIIPALGILLAACTPITQIGNDEMSVGVEQSDTYVLEQTPDAGMDYIDSLIFFGESTTYHLKSRGVLSDGTDTTQVWSPRGGTVNLDTTISTLKIVYPESGEQMTIAAAVAKKKPQIMVLTFGLNGAVQKHNRGEDYFTQCYLCLIDIIRQGSPDTKIILQSCFPIAADMDMSSYTVDAKTLNSYIREINSWTKSLALSEGCYYLNTCEVLCDSDGFLLDEFDVGDGHHLTVAAYEAILKYMRTHAIKEFI